MPLKSETDIFRSTLCISALCQSILRRESVSYEPFRSCVSGLCGGFCLVGLGFFCFFYTGGHICYQNVLPAVEQTISLTPVRLLVEGRQEKKLALAGEVLVYISVHPGMLCGCLLLMKIFQEPSFVI